MKARNKIKTTKELHEICLAERLKGKRIVFTNGCFDLIHVGHLRYLEASRELGDLLVIGVNSDASVTAIKGPQRPVLGQEERAELIGGLHCVDYVTLFDAPDPLQLISLLKPDVLVKGADWSEDSIVGAEVVRQNGGKVRRIPLVDGISTTSLITRILELHHCLN
jgi:D-beta-D-heptose 7-phosphate kinase/D-beta-D-heptose 1-phosphate adenosyltransferase